MATVLLRSGSCVFPSGFTRLPGNLGSLPLSRSDRSRYQFSPSDLLSTCSDQESGIRWRPPAPEPPHPSNLATPTRIPGPDQYVPYSPRVGRTVVTTADRSVLWVARNAGAELCRLRSS